MTTATQTALVLNMVPTPHPAVTQLAQSYLCSRRGQKTTWGEFACALNAGGRSGLTGALEAARTVGSTGSQERREAVLAALNKARHADARRVLWALDNLTRERNAPGSVSSGTVLLKVTESGHCEATLTDLRIWGIPNLKFSGATVQAIEADVRAMLTEFGLT